VGEFQFVSDDISPSIAFFTLSMFHTLFAKYIALDIEATGLGHGHKITELGAVEIVNFQPTGKKFQAYINPGRSVNPSAHKITGLTLNFLSKYPSFKIREPYFLDFIKGAVLLFHHSHYDLKLLREEMSLFSNARIALEDIHPIVDTLKLARKLHPNEPNNLSAVSKRYDIDVSGRDKHGALVDAELLADVFDCMVRKYKCIVPFDFECYKGCAVDFYNCFQSLQGTEGADFFKDEKWKFEFPKAYRFSSNAYDPQLQVNSPAVLVAFEDHKKDLTGVYVRYFMPNTDPSVQKKKFFYGDPEEGLVDIYSGGGRTIFISKMFEALMLKSVLLGKFRKDLEEAFDIESGFSIRACLGIEYLTEGMFDDRLRQLVILVNSNGRNGDELRRTLAKSLERLCNRQFLSLLSRVDQVSCFIDYTIKFDKKDWIVTVDNKLKEGRYIRAKSEGLHDLSIIITEDDLIKIDSIIVKNPNEMVLVAKPKFILKLAFLKAGLDEKVTLTQLDEQQLVINMQSAIRINGLRDLSAIEKVEASRGIYKSAKKIEIGSVVQKYFEKRGIPHYLLPQDFLWLQNDYHSLLGKYFPATLVPLKDEKGLLVGVHRIFCDRNGNKLNLDDFDMGKKRIYKLSLGRAVGIYVDVFQGSIDPDTDMSQEDDIVELRSEGIEDAIILKHVIMHTMKNNPYAAQNLFRSLGITNAFYIRSCVGINGLISIPLADNVKTVVLIADKDKDDNEDAKRTITETVEFLLNKGRIVKLTMPEGDGRQEKIDVNDEYLNFGAKKVLETLNMVATIRNIREMGRDDEPLRLSLSRIKKQASDKMGKQLISAKKLHHLYNNIIEEHQGEKKGV